jgi:hypothetical protein
MNSELAQVLFGVAIAVLVICGVWMIVILTWFVRWLWGLGRPLD